MNFKEYVESLQKLLKENPETANLEVIAAADDEGNDFNRVGYGPTLGHYSEEGDFTAEESYEVYDLHASDTNTICIN
jgi:hypothetical protein